MAIKNTLRSLSARAQGAATREESLLSSTPLGKNDIFDADRPLVTSEINEA